MKRVLAFLGILLVALFVWYFFIKQHDYQVRFQSETTPGTASQIIKTWNDTQEGGRILGWDGLEEVTQRLVYGDSAYTYTWRIKSEHDSLSTITAYIADNKHSFQNKWKLLFSDTDFEKRSRKTVHNLGESLLDHLKNIKVEILGEADSPESFCACVEVKTSQYGKAEGMMANYDILNSVIIGNNVQLNGPPLVRVNEWNQETDSLVYDFCYPIIRSEKLPRIKNIEYLRLFKKPSIKANYNGNYITSDRAWYALLKYAESQGMEVTRQPIEVFFNNPTTGAGDTEWLAEIYMPLKEQE
ncbi:MAG: AraC family transcriptional regulator, partial [Flavobacteriaceae bacterium]|nr:AraC family transcriptional regulator [Flavobacteriaceae bacterium]